MHHQDLVSLSRGDGSLIPGFCFKAFVGENWIEQEVVSFFLELNPNLRNDVLDLLNQPGCEADLVLARQGQDVLL